VMAGAIVSELGSYAVLAGSNFFNQGSSTISGNVGDLQGTVQGDLINFSNGQLPSPVRLERRQRPHFRVSLIVCLHILI
jgi:hypothetical protein